MHNIKLWSPNNKKTNLHKFINQLDKSLNIKNYADLHNWSIKHKNEFWTNVWDFTNFVGEKKGKKSFVFSMLFFKRFGEHFLLFFVCFFLAVFDAIFWKA